MAPIINEFLNTFSNKKSRFSSKRMERFAAYSCMLGCSAYFLIKGIYHSTLSASDLLMVVIAWLSYNGFNTIQIKKDIQNGQDNPAAD